MATDGMKGHTRPGPRPVLSWLPGYRREWLRSDVVAGLTSAAVVIPKAMACAVIAGLSVESGLYTALPALLIYPVLGTSRPLSVSTTTTIAMMTAAAAAVLAQAGRGVPPAAVGMTLALLVGAVMLLARLLRLGYIANFISTPVLVGFQAGTGAAIIVTQLGSVLGVPIHGHAPLHVFSELPGVIGSAHLPTILLAAAGIGLLLLLERRFPGLPAPLALVVLSVLVAALLPFESMGIGLVGTVPSGLPTPVLPDLALAGRLAGPAFGIALMSLTESVAAARTFAARDDPRLDPDRELTAVGVANIACGFLGGFPAGGGMSQTAVNDAAGARSQLAQVLTGLTVLITLLILSGVLGLLPKASLGALVIVVAASMIKPARFGSILRIRSDEFPWTLVAALGVFFIGILQGVLIAVSISLLTLLYQANHPPVYEVAYNPQKKFFRKKGLDAADVTFPGLLIVRTEGRLHFANAPRASEWVRARVEEARPAVIVLEMSAVPDIEYTALMSLHEQVDRLMDRGIDVWLATVNPGLMKVIDRSPLKGRLGPGRMFYNLFEVVEAYQKRCPHAGISDREEVVGNSIAGDRSAGLRRHHGVDG